MIPNTSDIYTYGLKTANASSTRCRGSVVLDNPSDYLKDYQLKVCYRKYKRKGNADPQKCNINLVFLHGNGMNKGLWHSHIDMIYKRFNSSDSGALINTVLAIDNVNHAHSAEVNKTKLGRVFNWNDAAKDVIRIIKEEEYEEYGRPDSINIVVGHSMGGFIALRVSYLEPILFDACVAINPVCILNDESTALLRSGLKRWIEKGFIKSSFDVPEGENLTKVVEDYYTQKSFFRKFDKTVLKNMLYDELSKPSKSNSVKSNDRVELNTPSDQEIITYLCGHESVFPNMLTYKLIEVPVYHVVSELDSSSSKDVERARELLKNVVIPIEVRGTNHLINGEQPKLTVDILLLIIRQRIDSFTINGDKRYMEKWAMKIYGNSYKQRVLSDIEQEKLGNGISKL
ncbi:uncharacterized protein PRCAT00002537001 [Priceomyces carsonii]|uniref:uncharacterized protein n=1 Tax=Priceomyces carsonii TaxID=28549 RepID=UPI002ED9792D|nr:unnamed protein product [Priceomyces carsonii]